MPGLHGIEVLREIKASSPQIQVIILTGHSTETRKKQGGSEALIFLRKPADIDLLVAKIKETFMEKVERL